MPGTQNTRGGSPETPFSYPGSPIPLRTGRWAPLALWTLCLLAAPGHSALPLSLLPSSRSLSSAFNRGGASPPSALPHVKKAQSTLSGLLTVQTSRLPVLILLSRWTSSSFSISRIGPTPTSPVPALVGAPCLSLPRGGKASSDALKTRQERQGGGWGPR